MNSQKAQDVLNKMIELFSNEQLPSVCAKAMIKAPEIPSSKWSLGNQLAMLIEDTDDARGYRQWEQVNRHVKKGSKAIYILVPMTRKIKDKDDKEKMATIGFRGMPVFRYEDTEGEPLKQYRPKELPPLYQLAETNGLEVKWQNSVFGESAYVDLENKVISLSTEEPDSFLHELVHWYDNKTTPLKPGQDLQQEIVAQLGACVLSEMYGYDAKNYTQKYIAQYAQTNSPQKVGQMCFKVLSRVQKVIDAILEDAQKSPLSITCGNKN